MVEQDRNWSREAEKQQESRVLQLKSGLGYAGHKMLQDWEVSHHLQVEKLINSQARCVGGRGYGSLWLIEI